MLEGATTTCTLTKMLSLRADSIYPWSPDHLSASSPSPRMSPSVSPYLDAVSSAGSPARRSIGSHDSGYSTHCYGLFDLSTTMSFPPGFDASKYEDADSDRSLQNPQKRKFTAYQADARQTQVYRDMPQTPFSQMDHQMGVPALSVTPSPIPAPYDGAGNQFDQSSAANVFHLQYGTAPFEPRESPRTEAARLSRESSIGHQHWLPVQPSPAPSRQNLQAHFHHHHAHPSLAPTESGPIEDDDASLWSHLAEPAQYGPPSVVGQEGMPEPAPRPSGPKLKFTTEDDQLLIELKERKNLTWKQIADFFPGRTSGTLQVRYCTKLKAKTTAWTDDMVRKLRVVLEDYEQDKWRHIASRMGNVFSPEACRDKAKELGSTIPSATSSPSSENFKDDDGEGASLAEDELINVQIPVRRGAEQQQQDPTAHLFQFADVDEIFSAPSSAGAATERAVSPLAHACWDQEEQTRGA